MHFKYMEIHVHSILAKKAHTNKKTLHVHVVAIVCYTLVVCSTNLAILKSFNLTIIRNIIVNISQLSCLISSVGRASGLGCVRRGFDSHLSAAFSLEKSCLGFCVLLCCFVFLPLFRASEYACISSLYILQ